MNDKARKAWREGIAPVLSVAELEALREALATDDPRLVQGGTIRMTDGGCEGACVLAYPGWFASSLRLRGDAVASFDAVAIAARKRLRDPADRFDDGSARLASFIAWFDAAKRHEMRRELLAEVEAELGRRTSAAG